MQRDASRCQVIKKFSFIESLSISRTKNYSRQSNLGKPNTDQAFSFQPQKSSNEQKSLANKTQQPTPQQSGAIVTTSDTATTIDPNWYQPTKDYSLSLAEIIQATTNNYLDPDFRSNFHSSPSNYWGRLFFALACSYGLFVIWWLFGYQIHNLLTTMMGGKNILLSKSDVEFIDYMERSLAQIEHKTATQKPNDQVVYVPVYTPASTIPPVPSNSVPVISNLPPVQPLEPLGIPTPPPLPDPPPLPENIQNIPVNNQVAIAVPTHKAIATEPKIHHTLIGVLELGVGNSAALVKVQGQTQKVWIGEEINSEGWILESITNQHANISYQGQIRSLAVGETF